MGALGVLWTNGDQEVIDVVEKVSSRQKWKAVRFRPVISSMGMAVAVAVVLGAASSGRALPAPKTEAEMMDMADLVVDAECVDIQCEGPPVEDSEKFTSTYISTLIPSQAYKGDLPDSIQIRGEKYDWKNGAPVGGWHQQPVPKGWSGKLYLTEVGDGTYTKVWWNAMEEDAATSAPLPVPSCGETGDDDGCSCRAAANSVAGLPVLVLCMLVVGVWLRFVRRHR